MDFGIVTAKVDEIGYITHAENLGYSHCWVTDSPMIRSNCWAVLALAARETRTMRLGTGVNVPGLRLAPVAANGIATINRLAPGRCFISLGTGHTGMRMLGQKPMRLGALPRVRARRAGAAPRRGGGLHPERRDPSASASRCASIGSSISTTASRSTSPASARRLRRWRASWPTVSSPACPAAARCPRCWPMPGRARRRAGRALPADFYTAAMVTVVMRQPGEASNSERIIAECGAAVITGLHYLVARHLETGEDPPEYARPVWTGYMHGSIRRRPEVRHQRLHGSHYSFVDPEEARFITADLIEATCLTGLPEELVELRIQALRAAGAPTDHAVPAAQPAVPGHRGLRRHA